MKNKGPISNFIVEHYKHFNSASLVDAAKGYETQLELGNKMMVTLAGAMSTAELGKSFAEIICFFKTSLPVTSSNEISSPSGNVVIKVMSLFLTTGTGNKTYSPGAA